MEDSYANSYYVARYGWFDLVHATFSKKQAQARQDQLKALQKVMKS